MKDVLSNILIGIISGMYSSIIVSRIFMIVQDYNSEFIEFKKIRFILYRIKIEAQVISNTASKYAQYEEDPDIAIGKLGLSYEITTFKDLVVQLSSYLLFTRFTYEEFETFRQTIYDFHYEKLDIQACNVKYMSKIYLKVDKLLDDSPQNISPIKYIPLIFHDMLFRILCFVLFAFILVYLFTYCA